MEKVGEVDAKVDARVDARVDAKVGDNPSVPQELIQVPEVVVKNPSEDVGTDNFGGE